MLVEGRAAVALLGWWDRVRRDARGGQRDRSASGGGHVAAPEDFAEQSGSERGARREQGESDDRDEHNEDARRSRRRRGSRPQLERRDDYLRDGAVSELLKFRIQIVDLLHRFAPSTFV